MGNGKRKNRRLRTLPCTLTKVSIALRLWKLSLEKTSNTYFFSAKFKKGEEDQKILEACGRHGWAMLTCDRRNRYRELERRAVLQNRVRQFVFSANLGGLALANLLVKVYQEMRKFSRQHGRPFVAIVTRVGNIYLRMDKQGNMHGGEDPGNRR